MMSPCGVNCSDCAYYPDECGGCASIKGKVFWTAFVNQTACSIYECAVNEKQLTHCGGCAELPCARYFDTIDPASTEEEHIADTNRRVQLLKETARQEQNKSAEQK